jgi:hypothetical protein
MDSKCMNFLGEDIVLQCPHARHTVQLGSGCLWGAAKTHFAPRAEGALAPVPCR